MIARMVILNVVYVAAIGALLFLLAGTLRWLGAWVFLIEVLALSLALGFWLAQHDPALFRERLEPPIRENQPPADKIVVGALIVLSLGWLAFVALDAGRFGWSSVPLWLQGLGALGIVLSFFVVWRTFRENSFAAPVVKIRDDRGQRVVTTGPYRHVRHPMYAGAILFFLGTSLLLGSWWGLATTPILVAVLAVRISIEEQALRARLPAYDAYAERVRSRLVPLIW